MPTFKLLQQLFRDALQNEVHEIERSTPVNLYHPISYTLQMGGKRLRPALLLMGCDLFNGNLDKALPAAIGIEIFHNFTLLHDDIMDHASLRRNKQTVHLKYNENRAILSGDAMSIMAYQYLQKCPPDVLPKIIDIFTQTAMEVCEGQQYDMDFETSEDVTVDDYLEMIRLKTAVLLAGSLKIGAVIGGASAKDADHLYQFGIYLGLAFQLQDDLLDVYANEKLFGKKTGGDIAANKKTFLLIKTLELAGEKNRTLLKEWLSRKKFDVNEKTEAVRNIYDLTGIRKLSEQLMNTYYQKSIDEITEIQSNRNNKNELISLSRQLIHRRY